jgi:hypothetical protein
MLARDWRGFTEKNGFTISTKLFDSTFYFATIS